MTSQMSGPRTNARAAGGTVLEDHAGVLGHPEAFINEALSQTGRSGPREGPSPAPKPIEDCCVEPLDAIRRRVVAATTISVGTGSNLVAKPLSLSPWCAVSHVTGRSGVPAYNRHTCWSS